MPKIFSDPNFPKRTKKILFNPTNQYLKSSFNSWININNYFFGRIQLSDVSSYAKICLKRPIKKIQRIKGRANSDVYKIFDNENYICKVYPDYTHDNRNRLKSEIKAYDFFSINKIVNTSRLQAFNHNLNFGIYKWIDGSELKKIKNSHILEASLFIKTLVTKTKNIDQNKFELASAACISGKMIEDQIFDRVEKINQYSGRYLNLNNFLNNDLLPLFKKVLKKSKKKWPGNFSLELDQKYQILSPSDFGFHNAKITKEGLKFFDFEYFGWDDPVKLTSDFILHPSMNLTDSQKKYWLQKMKVIFKNDYNFSKRFHASYSLYAICWCLINLNIYFKDELLNNSMTKQEKLLINEKRELQLKKSKKLLSYIEDLNNNGNKL